MGRTYIDRCHARSLKEHRPQPYGKVRGIEIGASRRAVSIDFDRPSGKNVSDEVADREMCVQRQVRTDKGEATSDLDLDRAMRGLKGAHLFGYALAFGVNAGGIDWVRATKIFLGHMREAGGLFAVNGPGTGEKKFASAVGIGEVENSRSTVDDGREHFEGMLGGLFAAGFGGGMDDVGKFAVGEGETADVAGNDGQGFVGCQVRALPREGSGVASENRCVCIEAKLPVDVGKTFEQPTAEEASAACNEDALVSYLVPERFRLAEDVLEIGGGQRLQCHRIGLTIFADVDVVWRERYRW